MNNSYLVFSGYITILRSYWDYFHVLYSLLTILESSWIRQKLMLVLVVMSCDAQIYSYHVTMRMMLKMNNMKMVTKTDDDDDYASDGDNNTNNTYSYYYIIILQMT